MKIILDFAVWTLGVSLALPIYLEKTYLPRDHDFYFWAVVVAIGCSLVSAAVGIWFRSAASKVLAVDPKAGPQGNERILSIGAAHSFFLLAAIAIAVLLFILLKVFSPVEKTETCAVKSEVNGISFVIEFDCGSSMKEIFESGKVVVP